ncbi:PAS domain S-box protein [Bradyrhizobium jicamae]|uniref:histidine kinase n=1 Tax=Bradyrhizobium jicamae TaxID=280332 RepID=A0ABS5FUG4_9BRAD|nr:PAS domain-containing protein [Bradyrhizobium jicamae]MBR0800415.1 PAS domain S-box protein [Bradyrhizobium jicamae]
MNDAEFQVQALADVRLAGHAASALPAWLWSADGARILWANPVGVQIFGAANSLELARRAFGPADPHRRQVARLGPNLAANGAVRLERLRGFGAAAGLLATCACARLELPDGSHGILMTALNATGRTMPLAERLQRLVLGIEQPAAVFSCDGLLIGANEAARPLPGLHDLSEAGLEAVRGDALKQGRAGLSVAIGRVVLQRIGHGADTALVALIKPAPHLAARPQPAPPAAPDIAKAPATDETSAAEPEPVVAPPPAAPVAEPPPAAHADACAQAEEAPTEDAPLGFTLFDALDPPPETTAETPAGAPVVTPSRLAPVEAPPVEPSLPEAPTEVTAEEEAEAPPLEAPPDAADEVEAPVVATPTPPADPVSSPYAMADAPAAEPPPLAPAPAAAPSWLDEPLPSTRRHPLRFMWQMDHEGRFSLGSDEFTRLIGIHTAAGFGRLWSEIAETFGLDPEGRVMKAFGSHDTWSGITLNWPVDGGSRLPVELSGLPVFDRNRTFAGYRGFGVCRDLDGLARLAALRRYEFFSGPPLPQPLSADVARAAAATDAPPGPALAEPPPAEAAPQLADPPDADAAPPAEELTTPIAPETSHPADPDHAVETPQDTRPEAGADMRSDTPPNVVPFRLAGDTRPPSLTPVENNAFNELARQLSARLESEAGLTGSAAGHTAETVTEPPAVVEPPATEPPREELRDTPKATWLAQAEPAPRGESRRDMALLDLLRVGILIYRLDRLLYANPAFLARLGYPSLHALEDAGGLDALYVEPGVSQASSSSGSGTPVTISASQAEDSTTASASADARLHTISWDGDSALALIFTSTQHEDAAVAAALSAPPAEPEPVAEPAPPQAGHADAEELGAILDTAAEGIIMFDAEGNINSCNRSAEALFGYDGEDFIKRNLAELFAPESRHEVFDYLAGLKSPDVTSLLDHGREALGRVRQGGIIPLSVTMGRTRADGPNFFAVFRDLSQTRKSESELREARRLAERAANARSDMLARISHELRTPLNAIIGFAEVMIGERFGALGNERYAEYMKDIRASGERVIAIVNDLLDLARIETGKLDLAFTSQNLNEMVESCVAVMQPQANRERIIIRTSLAHTLPPVIADARALRQITLNLIGNSIHLANAGGQVIVSTALSDFGEVMLRVRDTGQSLNDNEVAAALEPFRAPAPTDQAGSGGVSLSLTKALVEANRAKFQIRTGGRTGTLIEIVFSHAAARA